MTNAEALRRALKAIKKARDDSNHFEGASMASHEIMQLLTEAIEAEFAPRLQSG